MSDEYFEMRPVAAKGADICGLSTRPTAAFTATSVSACARRRTAYDDDLEWLSSDTLLDACHGGRPVSATPSRIAHQAEVARRYLEAQEAESDDLVRRVTHHARDPEDTT